MRGRQCKVRLATFSDFGLFFLLTSDTFGRKTLSLSN
nr:MAG TPA: hypothetical protein [Caudoviricetes sp.]